MPSYKVLKQGFFNGRLYDPEGKRPMLHTDKPFPNKPKSKVENIPSWLESVKSESAAQKKKRLAAEKKDAAEAAEKAEVDQKEIDDASFMGEGETVNPVETL